MAIPGLNFWKWLSLLKPLEGFSGALPQLHFSKEWITALISTTPQGSVLYLGGIPAGLLTWPNAELMAYQHLKSSELYHLGIPRLSREEMLPTIYAPSAETILEIQQGLRKGMGPDDFTLRPWFPPIESSENNVPSDVKIERLRILNEQWSAPLKLDKSK